MGPAAVGFLEFSSTMASSIARSMGTLHRALRFIDPGVVLKLLGVFGFKLLMSLDPFSGPRGIFIGCRRESQQEPHRYHEK